MMRLGYNLFRIKRTRLCTSGEGGGLSLKLLAEQAKAKHRVKSHMYTKGDDCV